MPWCKTLKKRQRRILWLAGEREAIASHNRLLVARWPCQTWRGLDAKPDMPSPSTLCGLGGGGLLSGPVKRPHSRRGLGRCYDELRRRGAGTNGSGLRWQRQRRQCAPRGRSHPSPRSLSPRDAASEIATSPYGGYKGWASGLQERKQEGGPGKIQNEAKFATGIRRGKRNEDGGLCLALQPVSKSDAEAKRAMAG